MKFIPLIRRKMRLLRRKEKPRREDLGVVDETAHPDGSTHGEAYGLLGGRDKGWSGGDGKFGKGNRRRHSHGGREELGHLPSSPHEAAGFRKPADSLPSSPFSAPSRASVALLYRFPDAVLERIFAIVCPHTKDERYDSCEESGLDEGCMLCATRDLAHCVATCRRWRDEGVKLL